MDGHFRRLLSLAPVRWSHARGRYHNSSPPATAASLLRRLFQPITSQPINSPKATAAPAATAAAPAATAAAPAATAVAPGRYRRCPGRHRPSHRPGHRRRRCRCHRIRRLPVDGGRLNAIFKNNLTMVTMVGIVSK